MFRRQVWWHIHDPIAGASRSTFLNVEPTHSIRRNQFATCEGALRLWALRSQRDARPAAHEPWLSGAKQAVHGAPLQRGVKSVGEPPAARELSSA